ncbi:MAG: hypothetical protein GY764_15880 [Halieaceae bacterium]|nr:hypothetical protein [Halieaceae bacterium]
MYHTRRFLLIIISVMVTLAITGGLVLALDTTDESKPKDALIQAFERARDQGSYHVVADIEQTLVPLATLSNLGKRDETSSMRLLGDVVQLTQIDGSQVTSARMQFYARQDQSPVELLLSDNEAFVGYKGRWKKVDDPLGGVAPGGDYMGYLVAAKDVTEIESVRTAEGDFRRFAFTLDSEAYAAYQLERVQKSMAGRLPHGIELQANPTILGMSGQGEVWLDSRGLPRRQVIDLNIPRVTHSYDAQVGMIVDFSRFGDPAPALDMPQPIGPDGAWSLPESSLQQSSDSANAADTPPLVVASLEPLERTLAPLASTVIPGLIALPLLILALLLIRRRRTLYAGVVSTLIVMMVIQPLLQAGQYAIFAGSRAEASSFAQALQDIDALPSPVQNELAIDRQTAAMLSGQSVSATGQPDCQSLYVDAGSQPSGDEDGDGLSNQIEWCLGTDYADVDTDGDTLTDTVELIGFNYGGHNWTADPLEIDSNLDGMTDGEEWEPALTDSSFTGDDTFTDKDEDGIPNLWDEDNDNDGVPDGLDNSPYRVMPYRPSFDVNVTGHSPDTIVYVDVQVQPENEAHLRYSLTSLDWPEDAIGQIQDLDSSVDDLILIPVLSINSTISPTLASQYEILASHVNAEDISQGFSLWVPLQPVVESGSIYAFSARLAFSSDEADAGIDLTEGRILWMVKATLDSCLSGDASSCDSVTSEDSVIANYYDGQIRVSGLQVSESKDVQVGLFGTTAPRITTDDNVDDEQKVMFTLISAGLAGTYLNYENPDLNQIDANFSDSSAQAPFTDTWGIDPAIMKVQVDGYDHRDEALATTTQTNTVTLLDGLYIDLHGVSCTINTTGQYTPTIATAYQETSGSLDLSSPLLTITNGDPAVTSASPVAFSIPLGDATIYKWRQVQLGSYGCNIDDSGNASWNELNEAAALIDLNNRYPDQAQATWYYMVQQIFLIYSGGRSSMFSVNGAPTDPNAVDAPGDAMSWFIDNETVNMPDYVRKVYSLDGLYTNVNARGILSGMRDWADDMAMVMGAGSAAQVTNAANLRFILNTFYGLGRMVKATIVYFKGGASLTNQALSGQLTGSFANDQLGLMNDMSEYSYVDDLSSTSSSTFLDEVDDLSVLEFGDDIPDGLSLRSNTTIQSESEFFSSMDDSIPYFDDVMDNVPVGTGQSATAETAASQSSSISKRALAVAIIMTAVFITVTWVMYSAQAKSLQGMQKDYALAQAIAATILLVLQLIISLILIVFASSGVGTLIELAIFLIVYIIVSAITGNWNPLQTYNYLTKWLADALIDFKLLSDIPKDGVSTGDLNFTMDQFSTTTNGPLPKAWYQITTTINTRLSGDDSSSWAYVRWQQPDSSPWYLNNYSASNSPTNTFEKDISAGQENCSDISGDERTCMTETRLQFQPTAAGRNTAIPFASTFEANLQYKKCWLGDTGKFVSGGNSCSKDHQYAYSNDPATAIDLATQYFYLDVLPASLDELFNWDAYEPPTSTVDTGDDSRYPDFNLDIDNDGLTASSESSLGTDDTLWDSDGDGLSDGFEYVNSGYGVDPTMADSDSDGLDDKDEYLYGTLPGLADTDGDGLSDGEEICRIDESGAPVGGWKAFQVGGYQICSDPLKGDADGDGLIDSLEMEAGLSPYAPDTAPRLVLSPMPSVLANFGLVSVLRAGDPMSVTLRLFNSTANTIDQPITLYYETADIEALTVLKQSGSLGYTPPLPNPVAGGLEWDTANNPLDAAESLTSTLESAVFSDITTSQVTEMQATALYTDVATNQLKTVTDTITVLIDEDAPSSIVTVPGNGSAINGNAFAVGGVASDPTSWPSIVNVRATGSGYDSGWQTSEGANSWVWTWTPLPDDGVYTIQSQTIDYVNNTESPGAGVSVIVDNTAPGAGFTNLTDGQALSRIRGNRVAVQGNATDLLSGAAQVAGLQTIQLSIDGRPWVNVENYPSTHPATATWNFNWTVDASSYGQHTLAIRAIDALGQVGDATEIDVIIDTLEPTDMWSNYQANLVAGQAFELLGHADDEGNVPLPARPYELESFMDSVISATVLLMPESYTDTQGMTVDWLGDVNGDARADFAVGMPAQNIDGQVAAGRVAVVYGSPGGWPIPSDAVALAETTASFVGSFAGVQLGQVLTPAGDANGDGLSDFLIGDPVNVQAYLVYGQATGLAKDFDLADLAQSGNGTKGKIFSARQGQVGNWISSAGDVNGDGFDEILVGVTALGNGNGAVYLVQGRTATSTSGTQFVDTLSGASAVSIEYFQLDNNGAVATGVGDINADGYYDFVIADPNNSFGAGQAAVYLFLGPVNWRKSSETGALNPLNSANASFVGDVGAAVGSEVVALGDVNGDGLPDFAYSSGNAPRVVYGRSSGWSMGMSADVSFDGYSPPPNSFIAAPGDVNVDGINDILLGATGGGSRAYLVHGSADLATNQPVQAQISGVSSAASAPYAAGADLNCDLSSDLLLVPTGEYTVQAASGSALSLRAGAVAMDQHGRWIGPAPRPRGLGELPARSSLAGAATQQMLSATGLQSPAGDDALTTSALAFRLYDNNIGDWVTDAAITGDWDGDGLSDVAGWTGSAWRTWRANGLNANAVQFTEYTNNMTLSEKVGATILQGDFDGDGLDDLAAWDGSAWQFERATGASDGNFSFAAIPSDLGALSGGDSNKMFVGDFDGDGKTDVAGWDGSVWATYISSGNSSAFNFTTVSNNLGSLVSGDAGSLISGDFDGDGMSDIASRNSDDSNWVVWISGGVSAGTLSFQQVTDNSLGYAMNSTVSRAAADFSGDGKTDVLALLDTDFFAWLSQASPGSGAVPFLQIHANAKQFSGSFVDDTLIGDFDGDGKADYASLNVTGDGWRFQLAGLATVRYVDDDYCPACANDGHSWDINAFDNLQSALDIAWFGDSIEVAAGVYSSAVIHAGQDYLTLRGSDPDAVFLDAQGGAGITILPTDEVSNTYPNIEGVTIQNLTIRNALTGIKLNYGGQVTADPAVNDARNVVIKHVLFDQDIAGSTAIDAFLSALWLRHNTLVSNASGVTLVNNNSGPLTQNFIFLQDNLFVALPNAAPLPFWWNDSSSQIPAITLSNGFASQNGADGDWQSSPTGTQMTVQDAKFLNSVDGLFRLKSGSAAIAQASNGKDQGYYTYRAPVYVDATYCENCENDGRSWGVDAFNSIQGGIASGAQSVLIEPGEYRERISLVNGVKVFGSGAGLTILAPPDDMGGYLVGVENARETALALITLAGEDKVNGITVDSEGDVSLKRLIVRNMGTAVNISGSTAQATLINDTIVSNENGVVASSCGNVDIRNSILAFQQQVGLSYETNGCPSTQTLLHNFNAYWRNSNDFEIDGTAVDQPGSGEIFADPRFRDVSKSDYRPLGDSPVVDAGDPSDPAPPGSGVRVDLGYAQAAEASVYASKSYCEQCLNDGLEWQVTAFDTIQDAVDNIPDLAGMWTVGVDGGEIGAMVYDENVVLKSGVRLVGNGAETTIIDANNSGSALTLNGVTNVEILGFTITDGGQDFNDAGILVSAASNRITITKNIIGGLSPLSGVPGNGNVGVLFQSGSSGQMTFNTIAQNFNQGVVVADPDTWLHARYNIIAQNDVGFDDTGGGQIFNSYNLVYNSDSSWCATCVDYVGSVSSGLGEINQVPLFTDSDNGNFKLTTSSPAVDAIPKGEYAAVAIGGGAKADMGYRELLAVPATLLLGKQGDSCGLGSAGISSVQVGLVHVTDATQSPDSTVPATWQGAALSSAGQPGSYWTTTITPDQGDGLYRLYSKPSDGVNNTPNLAMDWFRSEFIADGAAPTVNLIEPADGTATSAPAITLSMDVSDWVPTGFTGESIYNVAGVYFDVDGNVITATQSSTIPSTGGAQRYERQIALENGTHTIIAYASDQAGNIGQSSLAQMTVVTTQNEAALTNPAPDSAVASASVNLEGFVHYQDTSGDGQVEILVDGVSQGMAALSDTSAQDGSWSKAVTLAGDGSHTITMRASRTAGMTAANDTVSTIVLDTQAPSINFAPPTDVITNTIALSGSASDSGSGIASVMVSIDGGFIYDPADVDVSGNWIYTWTVSPDNDYATFPLRIRAEDTARNVTVQSSTAVVDNEGPSFINLLTASPQVGSHVLAPSTVELTWAPPSDGSGVVEVLVAVDQMTFTIPTGDQTASGNSYSAQLPTAGTWYIHLMTQDDSGNINLERYGPWYAGSEGVLATRGLSEQAWRKSIIIDANINVAKGEWNPETELLGSDPRPNRTYSLYASWDADYLYLGWRGPLWGPHGIGYIHFDTQAGGSLTTYKNDNLTLPFGADYVFVSSPDVHDLLRYVGGGVWEQVQDPGFLDAHGANGDTEIRLSRSAINANSAVQFVASVMDDDGTVHSVLPTDNAIVGPNGKCCKSGHTSQPFPNTWASAYSWPALAQGIAPNAGQPSAHHATVRIYSPDTNGRPLGPNSPVRYVFFVTNEDRKPLEKATLVFSGSEGIQFKSLAGWPFAQTQPQADRWFIELSNVAPGAQSPITITANLAEDLGHSESVTVTAEIFADISPSEPDLSHQSFSHVVDIHLPLVRFDLPSSGATLATGLQRISGSASDIGGAGVARTEIQVDNGPWIEAEGAKGWQADIEVPAEGTFTLSARAFDNHSHGSEIVSIPVTVDNVGPVSGFDLDTDILAGSRVRLNGQTQDQFPAGAEVQQVEVQIDGGPWYAAVISGPPTSNGTVRWSFNWRLPAEEGVQHALRVRAIDVAGNVGPASEAVLLTVDSLAPTSSIQEPTHGAVFTGDKILVWGFAQDGWGLAQVEVRLAANRPWQPALLGDEARSLLQSKGVVVPPPEDLPAGATVWAAHFSVHDAELAIRSRATDLAGNVEPLTPPLRVHQAPIRILLPLILQ